MFKITGRYLHILFNLHYQKRNIPQILLWKYPSEERKRDWVVNKTAFWLADFFFFRPLIGQYRVTPERSVKEGRKGWWMVHCQYSVTLPGETVPPIIIVTVNIWLGGNTWKRMLLTYWTGSSSQSLSDVNSLWIDYLQQIGRNYQYLDIKTTVDCLTEPNSLNIQNSRCRWHDQLGETQSEETWWQFDK